MPTELPITAAILALETGLPESKAISLIAEMRRAGKAVCHSRTLMVFRSDVAEFLITRAHSSNCDPASLEAKSIEEARDMDREAVELLKQIKSRSRKVRRRG